MFVCGCVSVTKHNDADWWCVIWSRIDVIVEAGWDLMVESTKAHTTKAHKAKADCGAKADCAGEPRRRHAG